MISTIADREQPGGKMPGRSQNLPRGKSSSRTYFTSSAVFSAPFFTSCPTVVTPFLMPCPVFFATVPVSLATSLLVSAVLSAALSVACAVFLYAFLVPCAVSFATSLVVSAVLSAALSVAWAVFFAAFLVACAVSLAASLVASAVLSAALSTSEPTLCENARAALKSSAAKIIASLDFMVPPFLTEMVSASIQHFSRKRNGSGAVLLAWAWFSFQLSL